MQMMQIDKTSCNMLCPKCHKAIVPGGKFCLSCGVSLSNEAPGTAPARRGPGGSGPVRSQAATGMHARRMPPEKITIGRSSECELVFSDPSISRKHCTVEKMPDGSFFLRDLQSKNGTFVDGVRVRQKHIGPASRIRLGNMELRGSDLLFRFPPKKEADGGPVQDSSATGEDRKTAFWAVGLFACLVLVILLVFPAQKKEPGPASQAGTESGTQAGNQAGNQAGSQAGNQAGTKAGNQGLTAEKMRDIERATVIVLVKKYDGTHRLGSGFFINERTVVTNRHVVENAQGIYVGNKLIGSHAARVLCLSQGINEDFAALDAGTTTGTSLALTTMAGRNEKVYAWGYPGIIVEKINWKGLPDVVSTAGEINVIRTGMTNIIVHSAKISTGNSGGPLVNENGDVVGINSLLLDDNRGAYYVSFASSDIISFLNRYSISYRKH